MAYVNKEAYREAVKAFPDDCAKDSETVHLLRMGYQVCYDKHKPINEIDMKSIEERATAYACAKCQCDTCPLKCDTTWFKTMDGTCDLYNKYRRSYIEIATEQKAIDDEYRKDIRYVNAKRQEPLDKLEE